MTTLHIVLRPHIERGGFHTDRFDALLDGEVICTSRSGWHVPARALLARGWPPETLLHVQHEGRAFDPTIKPQPIGELAKWTHTERDATGLHKVRWVPPEEIARRLRPDMPAKVTATDPERATSPEPAQSTAEASERVLDRHHP